MAMETDLRKANDIWTKHTPVKIYPVLASAVEATPQVGDDQQVNVDQVDDTPQVQEVQQVQNDNANQVENQVNTPNNSDQNTGANGAGAVVTPTEPIVGQETNTKEVAPPGNMSKDQMNPPALSSTLLVLASLLLTLLFCVLFSGISSVTGGFI
jgi:hypothetical protein